jgi:ribosomal protein S18 acetylase RimI-like enzyme
LIRLRVATIVNAMDSISSDPSTDIEIRLLSAADAGVLERVDDDVFDHPVQPALAQRYLANPDCLLVVAVCEGVVVGMASGLFYIHPDKPLQLFVNEAGVAGPYQGRGLGKRLVDALLAHARSAGCVEAWVATEQDNVAARRLYRAAGGVEDAARAVVYTWKLQ